MKLSGKAVIPAEVMARHLEGETVILDLASGTYYGLDRVGTLVWSRMAEGATIEDACRAVVAAYDVTAQDAERDVLELVRALVERRLIDVV